jgi:hypothetical protein
MAGANSNIQITDLDFNDIKTNLKNYLKSQNALKDYNFEGSALSVLLDILSYNTQYNAYYLNMVANEMFLDSAIQRESVVSLAKLLNYTPKSAIAPEAFINVLVNQVTDASLTLPKNTQFLSENLDGVNYNFVTTDATTVAVSGQQALFSNVSIKQGIVESISYEVDSTTNPTYTFSIPDENIDTTTLLVSIQQSISNTTSEIYTKASDVLLLTGDSTVYFLQESVNGLYEINFGDGILGKQLVDGNIVNLSYLSTNGSASAGANSFINMDAIGGFSNVVVTPVQATSYGQDKESVSSIKFQAPKSFSAQKRAVTKEDYITAIQQNTLGYSFDAVNVWGGQENDTPIYGQVFVCLKPAGSYNLTQLQKQKLIQDVIRPISVLTVTPTVVDPDYTYLQLTVNVLYDPSKTNLTSSQIKTNVKNAISNLAVSQLNTFNSTFNITNFNNAVNNVSPSIITNEISLQVQKKFLPILTVPTTYNLYYGTPLKKGMFQSGISTSPSLQFRDPDNLTTIISGVQVEEVPSSTGGVESISIINPGFGYQSAPTIEILGDGVGATAESVISATGTIKSINITNKGSGYTSAIVKITPKSNDTTGQLGAAIANLEGRYGVLRSYYNNNENVKIILNSSVGTVDYNLGVITLENFNPYGVQNDLGQLTVSANPTTSIISSTYNRIITVDPFDPNSIIVNVTAK